MRLLERSSQLAREYRTEVRVCPSGKSVDPKFLSSNDVLAHRRIVEEYASIRELIASVNTGAFGRSRPAADASREVVECWLLYGL
jgi:hypothetical protein